MAITPPPRSGPPEPRLGRLAHLPDLVRQEIGLYLAEGEILLDALFSASGPVGKLGELWMVVSDRSLYFYTREHGQNPVVALIARSDVRLITYALTPTGVTLTFQPANHPLNTVRVPFPKAQIKDVNQLCEDLAGSIPFEMAPPELRHPDAGGPLPASCGSAPEPPRALPAKTSEKIDEASSPKPPVTPPPAGKPPLVALASAKPASAAPVPATPAAVASPATEDEDARTVASPGFAFPDFKEPQGIRFIALATVISLLVGYLWYRLFQAITDRR